MQNHPLAGRGGNQVVDVDLVALTVTVDAAHPLLQPSGVPGQIVVEHQVAELQIDALAGSLGGHHHLFLVMKDSLGLVALLGRHRPINSSHAQTPPHQVFHQVIESVLRLGEDKQLLPGLEQVAASHHLPQFVQLPFRAGHFHGQGLRGQAGQDGDLGLQIL